MIDWQARIAASHVIIMGSAGLSLGQSERFSQDDQRGWETRRLRAGAGLLAGRPT